MEVVVVGEELEIGIRPRILGSHLLSTIEGVEEAPKVCLIRHTK